MLIAQLSDSHLKRPSEVAYGGHVDTAFFLRKAISHLNALMPRPDLVLLTGDLTDHGTLDQMDHVCSHLSALEIPLLAIPGNHDDRALFHKFFPELVTEQSDGAFSYVVDRGPLRFVMLDSSVPGKPFGLLEDSSLDLLQSALDTTPVMPTVVAVHHPPVEVGIEHMDRQNLQNSNQLAETISSAPHVLAILCGHIHRTIHANFAGTSVIVAPSPAHSVSLNLNPGAAPQFRMEPPAVMLHQWQPHPAPFGRLITHTCYIADYGADYPFFDGNGQLLD